MRVFIGAPHATGCLRRPLRRPRLHRCRAASSPRRCEPAPRLVPSRLAHFGTRRRHRQRRMRASLPQRPSPSPPRAETPTARRTVTQALNPRAHCLRKTGGPVSPARVTAAVAGSECGQRRSNSTFSGVAGRPGHPLACERERGVVVVVIEGPQRSGWTRFEHAGLLVAVVVPTRSRRALRQGATGCDHASCRFGTLCLRECDWSPDARTAHRE